MRVKNRFCLCIALISVLFLTGCPGASDYDIDLPGNYSIVRLSAHEVVIAPKISEGSWGENVIPSKVIEAGWNDEYIIGKQVELIQDTKNNNGVEIPDEKNDYFWIVEIQNGKVIGPLDEVEFAEKKQEYQISDEVVLKNIEDLKKNYSY